MFRPFHSLRPVFLALIWAWHCFAPALLAETVQLFVPTNRLNPAPGRSDSLRIEMKDVNLADLPSIIHKLDPVLPTFDAKHPPVVPIYLSHSTPEEQRLEIVREGKRRVSEAFPGLPIKFSVRYLEDVGAGPAAVEKTIVDSIDSAAKLLPQDGDTAKAADILKEATHRLARKSEEIRDELPMLSNPATMRKVVAGSAMGKALLSFSARTGQLASAGVPMEVAPILSSIALVGGDTALAYLANKYEIEIANVLTDHPLPIPAREGVLKRIQELYTTSQVAKLAKGTAGNIALWGVGVPSLWQTVAHFASPDKIALPSAATVGSLFSASLTGSLTYMAGIQGFEIMRQKGWIDQPAIDLVLRANGYLWTLGFLALSTGDPHLTAAAPFILGPMYAIYGAPAGLARMLPVRNNRIILVDPNLRNRGDLNQLEALEFTHVADPREVERAVLAAQEAEKIKNSRFQELSGKVADGAIGVGAKCLGAMRMLWPFGRRR